MPDERFLEPEQEKKLRDDLVSKLAFAVHQEHWSVIADTARALYYVWQMSGGVPPHGE